MAPKKNKKKNQTQKAEDDDWEALLEAEASANQASTAPAQDANEVQETENADEPKKHESSSSAVDAAAAFLEATGISAADDGEGGAGKKKRKKKKKGTGGGGEEVEETKVRRIICHDKFKK
jgi:hypothetical protein